MAGGVCPRSSSPHGLVLQIPKGPCTQIVYTLAPKYLYRDYFKAKVYAIWVHGLVLQMCRSTKQTAGIVSVASVIRPA